MNRSTREVSQGADVIHVEMRDDDVPHVVLGEPEPSGLPCRGLLRAEHGPDDVPEPPAAARQAGDVLHPKPVSTRTRPASVSSRRTWDTSVGTVGMRMVPQLR
jgi:hypothetical protein